MAIWKARSRVTLTGKRLEVTQIPTEGQSLHAPVWSKVDKETLLDMVEHLNSKTETIRVLFKEISDLKAANEELRTNNHALRFRRPAYGGHVPQSRLHLVGEVPSEHLVPAEQYRRMEETARGLGIKQEPGVMTTVMISHPEGDSLPPEDAAAIRRSVDAALSRCDVVEKSSPGNYDGSPSTDCSATPTQGE